MTKTAESPTLALIGCGAIAESYHLPALARHPQVLRRLVLVDKDGHRAEELARDFGAARATDDLADVVGDVDGAIVAVPHAYHHAVTMPLLEGGVRAVLCEKPLAETLADAQDLVSAAARLGAHLAVNHQRRCFPSSLEIKRLIDGGAIGDLAKIEISWGERFGWAAASGFYFGRLGSGRGALLDRGAHVVDLVCWLVGSRPTIVRAEDDSFGGSEATVTLDLQAGSCAARIELSWLSPYSNQIVIEGSRGRIETGIYDFREFRLQGTDGRWKTVRVPSPAATAEEIGYLVIDNLLDVLRGEAEPLVPATSVLDTIALTDAYYAERSPMTLPWHETYRRVAGA